MNLPNSITLLRLLLTIVYVAAATYSNKTAASIALISFCIAASTDWLDGYLARKLGLVTALGKLMDPLVDKILVCAAFVHLTSIGLVPMWATVLILGREFLVTGLRQIAVEQGLVIAADRWGKLKTMLQITFIITALTWLLLAEMNCECTSLQPLAWLTNPAHFFFQTTYYLSLILTVLSGINYMRGAASLFLPKK